jgi:hypothetical protein
MRGSEVLCGFGCGRAAMKQLKNGRFLCAEFVAQCPAMREKNAHAKQGRDPFEGRAHPRGMAGKPAWNRGRTLEECFDPATAERLRECSRLQAVRLHSQWDPQSATEVKRRERLSQVARMRGLGKYQPGSGRGRQGRYKGIWCDSSYELAFVIYSLDHMFPFERNQQAFPYEFEGRQRIWIPDFRLDGGFYLEIKGYVTDQVNAKFAAFPHPLIVVKRESMKFVFDYVIETYGRNFISLYE